MKYFGTDGFRGEANVGLTVEHAYKIGRFVGWYYGANRERKARVIVGKDTRRSSYMFEAALVSGLVASGADAYMLHVIPTPGVAHQTVEGCFDCGIMISASHNPFCDNGIKLVNSDGFKMDEDVLELIEDYIDGKSEVPLATGNHIGATVDYMQGRNRYIASLIASANFSLQGVKIGIDCANGSASSVAKPVFDALGADVRVINAAPDGFNINVDCGSTHIERLQRHVVEQGLDGVDLDWEYPVSGGAAGTIHRPTDKQNFTLLLQELREQMDRQGRRDGKDYALTIAGAAGSWYLNQIEADRKSVV